MKPDIDADVVVVGAGLSGLLAANDLQEQGARVILLDKGRGVGGRLSRRRTEDGVFDHGAQYFTARSKVFRDLVQTWIEAGLVRQWATGFPLSDGTHKDNGEPRYVGVSGMNTIPKQIARGLDVRVSARVKQVRSGPSGWEIGTEKEELLRSRALLMTPPAPQSLELLALGEVELPEQTLSNLQQIDYDPCLAVMALLPGRSLIPDPGGIWLPGEPIAWMADNQRKGISPAKGAAITIHAGPRFSRQQWEASEEDVTATLLKEAAPWLGATPIRTQLHRWRYSHPISLHPERCVVLRKPAPIAFAGDAFGGPRVEGAALSGLAASAALRKIL